MPDAKFLAETLRLLRESWLGLSEDQQTPEVEAAFVEVVGALNANRDARDIQKLFDKFLDMVDEVLDEQLEESTEDDLKSRVEEIIGAYLEEDSDEETDTDDDPE